MPAQCGPLVWQVRLSQESVHVDNEQRKQTLIAELIALVKQMPAFQAQKSSDNRFVEVTTLYAHDLKNVAKLRQALHDIATLREALLNTQQTAPTEPEFDPHANYEWRDGDQGVKWYRKDQKTDEV